MAGSSTKRVATRSLALLVAILIGLGALTGGLALWGGAQLTPRLGLDLEGGTEIVLNPVLVGNQQVSPGQIDQAVDIIRQRIDANGVAEAEISTLGGQNIVVAIPGTPTPEQLQAIRKPSQLSFRAVFVEAAGNIPTNVAPPATSPTTPSSGTPSSGTPSSGTPSGTAKTPAASGTATGASGTPAPNSTAANAVVPDVFRAATTPATPTATGTATVTPTPVASAPVATAPTPQPTAPTAAQAAAAIEAQVTTSLIGMGFDKAKAPAAAKQVAGQYAALDCTKSGAVDQIVDDPALPIATCGEDRVTKYVLGPVEIKGSEISDASSGFQAGPNGQPTSIVEVSLTFNSTGAKKFAEVTKRLFDMKGQPPLDQFAIVLDKVVISAPRSQAAIPDGRASITGSFTTDSAKALAQQLKFGALPISFALQTQDDITPQLGAEQLGLGLLAGAIGLLLVLVYSLFQYRALGLVTVVSLVVAATLSYLAVTALGTLVGFRLTMAGVTGLIVAIGVTADSFIVYFERIRDEVRDGRPLVAAVEAGWKRARRTIIAADAVNFIAAAVLYFLASSNVRGFAFTLGLTTLIDLLVVVLFTHPMVQLLARTEFFGNGHKWSGLDPERLGAKESPRYRGRGQFGTGPRPVAPVSTGATGFIAGKAKP
ncbi:MAG: protein translocase subunit SecD [Terracoccus sp.]